MHNKRAIRGGAKKMYALSYDYNLEYVAECWAIKCRSSHDKCRRTEMFATVGQNSFSIIGQSCGTQVFLQAIDTWFDEISGITLGCVLGHGSCMSVGHYTQMVWSKTTHVGCARVQMEAKICNVFCNYGPAGNKQGHPVYTIGPPAIDCIVKDPIYNHLCAMIPLSRHYPSNGSKIFKNLSNCFVPLLLSMLKKYYI
nr:venom allergen 5-like [Onthophagus taurus]